MLILAIDTCTNNCSLAIANHNSLMCEVNINNSQKKSSQIIISQVKNILSEACLKVRNIDIFVAINGPGSFTGTRVGVTVIKALAQTHQKKCIQVSSLESLANNIAHKKSIICPIIDAKNNKVYYTLYKAQNGELVRISGEDILPLDSLAEKIKACKEGVSFVGDGVTTYKKTLESLPKAQFAPLHLNLNRASSAINLAIKKIYKNNLINHQEVLPKYLKNFY